MANDDEAFLGGRLLVAMPGMGDPRFDHSVIFMCSHSDEGAMGLIINKPLPDLKFADLLKQLEIEPEPDSRSIQVYVGGPVEHGRGFVLHSPEYDASGASLKINPDFAMTATLDVLQDMAEGNGPQRALLALGYAGWAPGQLENEIQANGWLMADAEPDLVFGNRDDDKWVGALRSLGIDPRLLSGGGGRA